MTVRIARTATPAVVGVAGLGYAVQSLDYGLGSLTAPDSGFVPFLAGGLLAVSGAVVAVGEYRRTSTTPVRAGAGASGADVPAAAAASPRLGTGPVLAVVAGLFALVLWQTTVIGLLPAAAVLVGAVAYLMRVRLLPAAVTGVAFYFAAHVGFEYWLAIPLPHGYLQ